MPRSARTSGCRSRPAPRRRWPGPRCWPICRPATSPSARRRPGGCCASRNRRAASRPTSTPRPAPANRPPTSPGTARPRSTRTARSLARDRALPGRRRSSPIADVDLDLLRQERLRQGTFDDNRRRHAGARGLPPHRLPARPADGRPRLRAADRALPVRAGRPGPARPGLLRGLQHPGRRPGAAAARDAASGGSSSASRAGSIRPRR